MQSSFFVVDDVLVLELRTESLRKCTEIASKTSKTSSSLKVQGQFEAFFFRKLNLSRTKCSPVQQIWTCFRCFNTLVHEIDKGKTKSENRKTFEILSLSISIPEFPFEKLHSFLF